MSSKRLCEACGTCPLSEHDDAFRQDFHNSIKAVPNSAGDRVKAQRTNLPPTTETNQEPDVAGTILASHQQVFRTGLHSPVRVMSDTRS